MQFKFSSGSRWAFICGVAIGTLIALPLAASYFDGKILEPVATLWGNALGAIGAVAAAIWAADRASNLQRRQGASLILTFVSPMAKNLTTLTNMYKAVAPVADDELQPSHVPSPDAAEKIGVFCQVVMSNYRTFKDSMHRIEPVLTFLGPAEMQAFFALEAKLEEANSVVGYLTHHAATAHDQSYGHTPSTGIRTNLVQANRSVHSLVSQLEKAAR